MGGHWIKTGEMYFSFHCDVKVTHDGRSALSDSVYHHRSASAPPALHLFAHFWITQEFGAVRHCQDDEGWEPPTELQGSSETYG